MSGRRAKRLIHIAVLTALWLPLPILGLARRQDHSQSPAQAHKKHPDAPDIAVLEVQSLGRSGPDPNGEIGAELLRVKVKNWTIDRTITGILWEISVYDAQQQKVVEVLKPYTTHDMIGADISLKVPPGYMVEIPFYISRKVHIDANHASSVKIKSYVYRMFDKSDKPANISYLVAEDWPFKTDKEPVLVDEKH